MTGEYTWLSTLIPLLCRKESLVLVLGHVSITSHYREQILHWGTEHVHKNHFSYQHVIRPGTTTRLIQYQHPLDKIVIQLVLKIPTTINVHMWSTHWGEIVLLKTNTHMMLAYQFLFLFSKDTMAIQSVSSDTALTVSQISITFSNALIVTPAAADTIMWSLFIKGATSLSTLPTAWGFTVTHTTWLPLTTSLLSVVPVTPNCYRKVWDHR